jgi:hypothetical protein
MNALIKNEYLEKRCFIVATGPSLAEKDLSFLKDEFVISLNLCPLTLDMFNITPQINVVADKMQYLKYKEVFEKLTFKKNVLKVIIASACETFPEDLIDKKTFFFPKKLQQKIPTFSKDPIMSGFSRGKTVAFDAIQLAFFMGFKEVYLLGMDLGKSYDWGKNGHSYELIKNPKFKHIKFATKDDTMVSRGLPGHPEYWDYICDCMLKAKESFCQSNKKIINDISSKLEIFERIDICERFGGKNE